MVAKVQKWGNSLGVRIPKALAEQVRVRPGADVDLSVQGDRLVIKPVAPRRYRLEDLVAKITPRNRHEEVDWGAPRGREAW